VVKATPLAYYFALRMTEKAGIAELTEAQEQALALVYRNGGAINFYAYGSRKIADELFELVIRGILKRATLRSPGLTDSERTRLVKGIAQGNRKPHDNWLVITDEYVELARASFLAAKVRGQID
jgi:hypothetical protein